MWTLDRPEYTARTTFTACISRVRNLELKTRLEGVIQAVVDASNAFDAAAEQHSLYEVARDARVGGVVTTEEMEKVYTQRMAKIGAPGRAIYDEIFSSSPQGRCPLCAQRPVATLDHHLPKAHYPALAVTPLNLVPSCADCNKAKLASIPQTAADVGLHPYYDEIDDEAWLAARVIETRPAAVRFRVVAPDAWDTILAARVRNHFRTLGLAALYASEAAEELVNIRHQLFEMHDTAGMYDVREELRKRAESCALGRRNGWRAATYSAWAESDWFCDGGFAPEDRNPEVCG
jgi:hypothetical protein